MSHVVSPTPFSFVLSGVESQSSPSSDEISAKFWIVPDALAAILKLISTVFC
jgi:hypothetical protein